MESKGIKISSDQNSDVKRHQKQGKTVSYIAIDDKVEGFLIISDAIKSTSKQAIQSLMNDGVMVYMLTGDNHNTAQAVEAKVNDGTNTFFPFGN